MGEGMYYGSQWHVTVQINLLMEGVIRIENHLSASFILIYRLVFLVFYSVFLFAFQFLIASLSSSCLFHFRIVRKLVSVYRGTKATATTLNRSRGVARILWHVRGRVSFTSLQNTSDSSWSQSKQRFFAYVRMRLVRCFFTTPTAFSLVPFGCIIIVPCYSQGIPKHMNRRRLIEITALMETRHCYVCWHATAI